MNEDRWSGFRTKPVNLLSIDGQLIQIDEITGNAARGHIVSDEGAQKTLFVAKDGDIFSTGDTERRAELALKRKIFSGQSEDARIDAFVARYNANDRHTVEEWMESFSALTGACGVGSYRFIKKKGLHRYDTGTTLEFLDAVSGEYGGDIIEKIKKKYDTIRGEEYNDRKNKSE